MAATRVPHQVSHVPLLNHPSNPPISKLPPLTPQTPTLTLTRLSIPLPRRPLNRHPFRLPPPTRRPPQNPPPTIPHHRPPPHPPSHNLIPSPLPPPLARHPPLRHPHRSRLSPLLLRPQRPPPKCRAVEPRLHTNPAPLTLYHPPQRHTLIHPLHAAINLKRPTAAKQPRQFSNRSHRPRLCRLHHDSHHRYQSPLRILPLRIHLPLRRSNTHPPHHRAPRLLRRLRRHRHPRRALCGSLRPLLRSGKNSTKHSLHRPCPIPPQHQRNFQRDAHHPLRTYKLPLWRPRRHPRHNNHQPLRCGQDTYPAHARAVWEHGRCGGADGAGGGREEFVWGVGAADGEEGVEFGVGVDVV